MLQILPVLDWLAPIISAVLLATLWNLGEFRRISLVTFVVWFLTAAYFQFLGGSPLVRAVGILTQTVLAIVLTVRFRFSR